MEYAPHIGVCTKCNENVVTRSSAVYLKLAVCDDCKLNSTRKKEKRKKYMKTYMEQYRKKDVKLKKTRVGREDDPKVIAKRMNEFRRQSYIEDERGEKINRGKSYKEYLEDEKNKAKQKR